MVYIKISRLLINNIMPVKKESSAYHRSAYAHADFVVNQQQIKAQHYKMLTNYKPKK